MPDTTRVNFHCHSVFSDGELAPEALAESLAAAGVRYAALTDHDSIEGLPRFQEALKRRGIGCISGVEMTAQFEGREVHLLGFGFDAGYPRTQGHAGVAAPGARAGGAQHRRVAAPDRRAPSARFRRRARPQLRPGRPHRRRRSHRHAAPRGRSRLPGAPLTLEPEFAPLGAQLEKLKALGLDGIEAIYEPFTGEQQAQLIALARAQELLVCAGTDVHAAGSNKTSFAVDMPSALWKEFRDAIRSSPAFAESTAEAHAGAASPSSPHGHPAGRPRRFRRRYFVLRILLPALLALALFVAGIWVLIIPSFERSLLDRKREMIRELTNSAWSILASYERDERAGRLTRQEAQALAKERIEALRYGPEGKDYFWLQDLPPRIIMHPYRPDLNGQDVSGFTDPRGVPIFVEFADLVRRKGAGYIEYVWQWKDDPDRLAPKESYVKGFEPWGWVIGTGLYIDDVNQEIARLEQNLLVAALAISGGVVLLVLFVVQQSLRIEHERREVENSLRESTERYRSLVEATTEGALLVLDGRCRYANPVLLGMLGYTMRQLELMDLSDILPPDAGNEAAWARIRPPSGEPGGSEGFEGVLQRSDGERIECVMALNPISLAGSAGFILLARDVFPRLAADGREKDGSPDLAQAAPVGLFRAKPTRRGVFIELNPVAEALIRELRSPDVPQPGLADLIRDATEYDAFMDMLHEEGGIEDRGIHLETADARTLILSLSATLVRDEHGHPAYIDGVLKDVTAFRKHEAELEAMVGRLQTSLLFLHEPVGRLGRDVVRCGLETPIHKLAAMMTARNATAALVETESGAPAGIVTDRDLRARVVAGKLDARAPARAIMSAPLVTISEHALIYEALMLMEENDVQHLAVADEDGRIVSVIRNKELIQFQRYGSIVLTREISQAGTPEEVALCCERAPGMVQALMDNGARPRNITHMLSAVCDAAVERFIALGIDELGPPPAAYAFIAMGSHGRLEQTLLTDQDNAIIYAAQDDPARQASAADYFLRLGTKVSDWLVQAGYPACRGGFMASNPRWCQPLPEWKRYFGDWISKAESQELLEFSIFFDFRTVHGDAGLAHELRRHIHGVLSANPGFFPHFARQALMFVPPVRLFGGIYLSGGSAEHAGMLNLKDALMPVVDFARLYALRHQVDHTHTLDRIDALLERDVVVQSSRDDITTCYDVIMRLRLQRQLDALKAGQPFDNTIHPRQLRHVDEMLLRQAFSLIAAVQKKINYDFFGTAAPPG